jgi:hypothetical protein
VITISINGQERDGIDEAWIAQRISGFRRDDQSVCVRVKLKTSDVDIMVTAGVCEGTSGAPRPPRPSESALLKRWTDCGLSRADFELGHLIRCLKQLDRDV